MGDQLEARISSMEHVQEEFGHEIREIKKELSRLAKLIKFRTEAKVVQPQEFSPSPTQPFPHFGQHPNPRPNIPVVSNEACHPNMRYPLDTPKTVPFHTKASMSSNQSNNLENHPEGPKAGIKKIRWDPSSSSYAKLFSKLMESALLCQFTCHHSNPHFPGGMTLIHIAIFTVETLDIQ